MYVYVINKNGNSLMPCKPAKAKHLLRDGKAKVIKRTPFTIKLLWDCEENVQEVIAGMDPGSKEIGCAAISNGKVIYQSEIHVRNDVKRKMTQRRGYRRNRRSRKLRYREPRWNNRAASKREGRIAPSIKSKIDSHLREKNFIKSILPVSEWHVETAKFDIHKMINPEVRGKDYQEGNKKGFYNTKAYILDRDGYKCQHCKAKNTKLHVHHIIFQNKGGTHTPSNLITLCKLCHEKLHAGEFEIKGKRSTTQHATHINIISSQLRKLFGDFEETYGYETKFKREQILKLPKTHANDAIAICCEEGEVVDSDNTIYYKRHVCNGDYRQTMGRRSEKTIPTDKLFGIRKFDLIKTARGVGFVKGKMSTGGAILVDIHWNKLTDNKSGSVSIKKNCKRIAARTTTLIEKITIGGNVVPIQL